MSFARLFRDACESLTGLNPTDVSHWTMNQLFLMTCDKEKHLPKRTLPRGHVQMSMDEAVARGFLVLPETAASVEESK